MRVRPQMILVEIDSADLKVSGAKTSQHLALASEVLARAGVVAVRIHPSEQSREEAVRRAHAALELIRRLLITQQLLPNNTYVEVDAESRGVPVAPFHDRRFLLPHQDGGHSSFLTPSRFDCPEVTAEDRLYSSSVYWRRPSHKMFQGFMVIDPGQFKGVTYYYDALNLLEDAFAHQTGRQVMDISELARFELENLRRSKRLQPIHGSRYFTLGAFLGSHDPAHHVAPSGPRGESEFWPAQYLTIPNLVDRADDCPCGECDGPGMRLMCDACVATIGMTWPQVRKTYESAVEAERHDLLISNNLTLYHAAESHMSRTIAPLCIVAAEAAGDEYERWLSAQWIGFKSGARQLSSEAHT